MPAVTKQSNARRQEVRRTMGRTEGMSLRRLWGGRRVGWALCCAAVFWVLATVMVVQGRGELPYRAGELVDRSIVSRVDVRWLDEKQMANDRRNARDRAPTVYMPNEGFYDKVRQELITLPAVVANAQSVHDVATSLVARFQLDDEVLVQLKEFVYEGQSTPQWKVMVDGLVDGLRLTPIVTRERYQNERSGLAAVVKLKVSESDIRDVGLSQLVNLADREDMALQIRGLTDPFPQDIRDSLMAYLQQTDMPGYVPDVEATNESRQLAEQQVERTMRLYPVGYEIVAAGTVLEPADVDRLAMEQATYRAQLPRWAGMMAWVGPATLVLLVVVGIGATIFKIRPRVAENATRALALTLLLLGTLALAHVLNPSTPYITAAAAVGAAMLAAVILVIAYDQQFAIAISCLHAVLIALALNLSAGMYFIVLAGCVVTIAQLRSIRQRGTLVRTGFVTGSVVGIGAWAVGMAEANIVPGMLLALSWQALGAFIAAVLIGFFVLGILPLIERVFRVTTAMSLLELGDVNRPLLRKLAQAAPGTFNHSLTIAIIAEAAAEAIDADGLLCRVGAYYHDIGKMNKPQYFIENQGGGPNRHDKLSPAMSLLIIVGHVKDGVEMAREYGLPRVLHPFIATHHGTTLVEYFYHAAKQQVGEGDAQPREFEFRYPGPKPQSREAAILMLCDTVESAARSMSDPTPNRIEQLVHKLALKRLMDGQFDDAALTLDELRRVEEAITKSLSGIYHSRIKYPSDKSRDQPPQAPETKPGLVAG